MLRNNRVIIKTSGSLRDLSINLSNPLSGTEVLPITASTDAIYIGSDLPFNHRHFEVSVANAQTSVVTVSLWSGNAWVPCVDLIDETAVSGKTLAQSGIISWVPNRNAAGWTRQLSTENISDLSTLKIYDFYWAKITFSADLTGTTALKYVGHLFSKDEDLFIEYPDLSNSSLMTAHTSGKTAWKDQAFVAAEYVIERVRNMGVIWSPNQILDWRKLKTASIHKTAEIIFQAFGEDKKDDKQAAAIAYRDAISMKLFNADVNMNGILDVEERFASTGWMSR